MIKKLFLILITPLIFLLQGAKSHTYVIDPTQNANIHNNKGLSYLRDDYYIQAIQEFKLAILLNPDSTITSTFYDNLGSSYIKIKRYDWAQTSYEQAININPNFFDYYKKLVYTYKMQNKIQSMLTKYKDYINQDSSVSSAWLMSGLIYSELGNYNQAVDCFDKYILLEPDLILTDAIRTYNDEIKKSIEEISL